MAKNHVLQVRVEQIEMERLRQVAKAWDMSVSDFVRMVLEGEVVAEVLRIAREVPHG